MSDYTLAGPAIGTLRCDLAALYNRLGEDDGLAAANAAGPQVSQIPGQDPPLYIRLYKGGDEGLDWTWFQRKASGAADKDVAPHALSDAFQIFADTLQANNREVMKDEEERTPLEEQPPLVEHQAHGVTFTNAQHAMDAFQRDPDGTRLFHVPVDFTISVTVDGVVSARNADEAFAAMQAYVANRQLPEGAELHMHPQLALNAAWKDLVANGSFEGANWTLEPNCDVRRFDRKMVEVILRKLVRAELDDFQECARGLAESNVDLLTRINRRL